MLNELRRPYNAVTDFVDANVARGLGNKIAFIDPERSLTYDGLQARSIRFANALRELGVEHEQRVALLLNDTVDYPVAFWGTIRAGAIAIPLNTYLPHPQYAYILNDCRATALVVDTALARNHRARARQTGTQADLDRGGGQRSNNVMVAHSRPKHGVLSHAYVAAIHVFLTSRRGCPEQVRA